MSIKNNGNFSETTNESSDRNMQAEEMKEKLFFGKQERKYTKSDRDVFYDLFQ